MVKLAAAPWALVPGAAWRHFTAKLLEVENLRRLLLHHVGEERDPEAALFFLAIVLASGAVLAVTAR
jgi:hypothetical protein